MQREKEEICGSVYESDTYGRSLEKILLDVFGVATARNFYFEQKLRELAKLIANESREKEKIRSAINYFKEFNLTPDDPLFQLIERAEQLVKK